MAVFSNFATLSYSGGTTTSNTVTGEILEAISASKTAVVDSYTANDRVTYVVTLVNSSTAAVTGLTVTDDLGGYQFGTDTVYPLEYIDGSVLYYVNGVLQATPAVTAGPELIVSGISVPAGGNAIIIYETAVTGFAPLAEAATIVNNVTVTGNGLATPVIAQETVTAESGAALEIRKAVNPAVVTDNGRLTYTFVIENTGNTAANATDNVVVTDNFDPILTDITVTLNGAILTEGVDYSYNEATGEFATVAGVITVPEAIFTQNADGSFSVTPGTATLVITGTV